MTDDGKSGFDMPPATTTDRSAAGAPVALLPIGSFEQHGPYLPLVTDTLIATVISESISNQHNTFQLPALAFGCSHEHAEFPGTVSISAGTLIKIVNEVVDSLRSQGILGLIVVNAPVATMRCRTASRRPTPRVQSGSGCSPVARIGRKHVRQRASRARLTTTCTPASSKRPSCSPLIPAMSVTDGRRPTIARPIVDTSRPSA